jgi:pimeloyl-ACP methyl ester carboxylesterase
MLRRTGHMPMIERPDEVAAALLALTHEAAPVP